MSKIAIWNTTFTAIRRGDAVKVEFVLNAKEQKAKDNTIFLIVI